MAQRQLLHSDGDNDHHQGFLSCHIRSVGRKKGIDIDVLAGGLLDNLVVLRGLGIVRPGLYGGQHVLIIGHMVQHTFDDGHDLRTGDGRVINLHLRRVGSHGDELIGDDGFIGVWGGHNGVGAGNGK